MAKRKQEPIRTVSMIHVGEQEVVYGTSDPENFPPYPFTPEERREIATRLKLPYLNELWRGKAEFYRA